MRKNLLIEKNGEEVKNADENDEIPLEDLSNQNLNNEELWRVGIICKKDCYDLTKEILKILEKNGYEWKIISSSYKIKCRKKIPENTVNNNNPSEPPLKVLIQIFGDIDNNNKTEFLVDLHKLEGSVMEFLEFSSDFVSSIQQAGILVIK